MLRLLALVWRLVEVRLLLGLLGRRSRLVAERPSVLLLRVRSRGAVLRLLG